ncbi:MarR family transcriptional regulator [Gottfriedia luciferensis]|uniref:MarR family transcriptional regulator n=1 Tax=Gottfriedia luciferensis TaxID=178774 RepID=UPI000B4342B1|nr:MarR family transcriptional regulator [Gottfriedia luciferensis]
MGKKNLGESLGQAEKNARFRDIQKEKVLTEEELEQAAELQAKANARKMILIPEKKVKSRVKFVQILQTNWLYLLEIDYLKNEEMQFLLKVIPFIGFLSNCIVHDITKKEQIPMNQKELADKLKSSKQTVNRLVNQLIDKGIMAKSESGKEDINARMYALFLNPNIIFSGDRDKVNQTLQAMFRKTPKALKNLPERLF